MERLKEIIKDREAKIETLEGENKELKKKTASFSNKASMIGSDSVVGSNPPPSIILQEQREQGPLHVTQSPVLGKGIAVQSNYALKHRSMITPDLTSTTLTQSATDTE